MRVLYTYKDYAPIMGGIENHIRTLAIGLRSRGIATEVLVTNTSKQSIHETLDGVPVTKTARQLNIQSAPISLGFYSKLYSLSKQHDIVHAHAPYPPGEIGQLLFGRSQSFVMSYHSDIVRQRLLGALYAPFLRLALHKAGRVAVATPAYLEDSRFLQEVRAKCRIIPYGTDLSFFARSAAIDTLIQAIRNRYPGKQLILFIGRLRHYKGVNVLIEAMKHLPHMQALIVGIGPFEEQLKAQAAATDYTDRISFLGEVSDQEAVALRHAADLFVLSSTNRAETFGIVQIEAMACGLPCVSTELGTGTSWVNRHGETGLVVPANNADALAQAIQTILSNPDLRQRMGQAARQRAQNEFSQEAMLDKMIAFYQEALSSDVTSGHGTLSRSSALDETSSRAQKRG